MELQELKGRNAEIYWEYLNSCIAKNEAAKNTTYRTYFNNMKQFVEYVKKTSARERKNKLLEIRKKAGF